VAGQWVRADLALPDAGAASLAPGTHLTSAFDPIGDPTAPIRLSYTVPEGWTVDEDGTTTLVLHHGPAALPGQPSTDSFVVLLAQPRMAADLEAGAACGPVGDAPGVGGGLDALVAAIVARPGVVSTPPTAVTIGGHGGRSLDLTLSASWTGGCRAPEGPVVGLPILVEAGSATGPVVGLAPDHPVRLILLDLAQGRTMAIAIYDVEATQPSQFEAHVAEAMPIVESLDLRSATR
jgi:hypothetical protein